MAKDQEPESFAQIALPHLDVAYNLARWLTRDEHLAEDVVQEAYLRAFRFFSSFRGGDGKAWLLAIVRNTFYSMRKRDHAHLHEPFDEKLHDGAVEAGAQSGDPEALLMRSAGGKIVREAIEALPAEFREVLVLREIEELSYKDIALVAEVPVGTVMSRLARARKLLRRQLERANGGL